MRLSFIFALVAFTILASASPIVQKRAGETAKASRNEVVPNGGPLHLPEGTPTAMTINGVSKISILQLSKHMLLTWEYDPRNGESTYIIDDNANKRITKGTVKKDGTTSYTSKANGVTTHPVGTPLHPSTNDSIENFKIVQAEHDKAIAHQTSEKTGGGGRTDNTANEKSHHRR